MRFEWYSSIRISFYLFEIHFVLMSVIYYQIFKQNVTWTIHIWTILTEFSGSAPDFLDPALIGSRVR